MERIFRNNKNKTLLAVICSVGWSLAYPFIKISIYSALIPVLGGIFAALLLKEELKWQYFISVLLVAAGIWLVNREKS